MNSQRITSFWKYKNQSKRLSIILALTWSSNYRNSLSWLSPHVAIFIRTREEHMLVEFEESSFHYFPFLSSYFRYYCWISFTSKEKIAEYENIKHAFSECKRFSIRFLFRSFSFSCGKLYETFRATDTDLIGVPGF